jgi:hypothetical protein
MIRNAVDFQRGAMEVLYKPAKKSMQIRTQVLGNNRQPILCTINDVIEEIRVRHLKIITQESREK